MAAEEKVVAKAKVAAKLPETPKEPAPKLVIPKAAPPVEVPVVEKKEIPPVVEEVPVIVEKVASVVAGKKPFGEVLSVEKDEDEDEFSISSFDASLFFDGASDGDEEDDAVQVDEPIVSVSMEPEKEKESAPAPEPPEEKASSEQSDDDWLGGLLSSLDKAKK